MFKLRISYCLKIKVAIKVAYSRCAPMCGKCRLLSNGQLNIHGSAFRASISNLIKQPWWKYSQKTKVSAEWHCEFIAYEKPTVMSIRDKE